MDESRARAAAAGVRLLVLDVDGVLTDRGLYYDAAGVVTQRFDVRDGMGIKLAQWAGLKVAVISGLSHQGAQVRAAELGVDAADFGRRDKAPAFAAVCRSLGVESGQAAYLGDDWVDGPAMRLAGLPMAVADAEPEIRDLALFVCRRPGGHGAVREVVRFILEAQGRLETLWRDWLARE